MNNKSWLFFIVTLLNTSVVWGQSIQVPAVIPASPEASALAKYINYPLDHSSGLVKISIPLYEIRAGDLTLPIGLSYHASGIKVNENSGIVGLGWSLNAEPAISRSIQGREDEKGYLRPSWSPYPPDNAASELQYRLFLANSGVFDWADEQPDEFYYRLLEKSGGFFIGKNLRSTDPPQFVTHPYAPISIDNNNIVAIASGSATAINSFNLVDDRGVRYNFSNVETSIPAGTQASVNTSWKATSITSAATSQVISFQYQPGHIETMFGLSDMEQVHDSISGGGVPPVSRLMGCEVTGSPTPRLLQCINSSSNCNYKYGSMDEQWESRGACYPSASLGGDGGRVNTIRLKEIHFNGGKVVFTMKTLPKHGDCVDIISVYNSHELIKQVKFHYQSYVGTITRDRILLKSIEILDKNGVAVEKYQFSYNGTVLPDYLSKSVDYWGYYNGASNDYFKSFVPRINNVHTNNYPFNHNKYFSIGSANREPNFHYAQALTLTGITYPTGGYKQFIYQPNQYKVGNQVKNAGGLRIYKVIDRAPPESVESTYTYGDKEDGAGILRSHMNVADAFSFEQIDAFYDPQSSTHSDASLNRVKTRSRTFFSRAQTDLFFPGGGSVFYNTVTEYLTDLNGNSLGKTEYKYRHEGSGGTGWRYRIPKTTLVVDAKTDWMYGQLESKKVYSGNRITGEYTLISSNGYRYNTTNYSENSINVGKTYWLTRLINYEPFKDPNAHSTQWNSLLYVTYGVPTGAMVLSSDTTTTYDGGNKVVTINEYTYGNSVYVSPTKVKTTGSDGKTIITTYKYPHDVTLTGLAETGRQKLMSDWRIGTLLEKSQIKGTALSKTRTDYGIFHGKAQPAQIVTNTGPNFSDEPRIVFYNYNSNGNALTVSKANDTRICYLWGYNGRYPIVKIEGIEYSGISADIRSNVANKSYTSGVSYPDIKADVDYLKSQLSGLIADPRYNVTIYTYALLIGMTSQTDTNGVTTFFEYDAFGRLKLIRDSDGNILNSYTYNYVNTN